jgi:hypothetical protein
MTEPTERSRDPLADAIRSPFARACLRVGVPAGIAVWAVTTAVTMAASYLPRRWLEALIQFSPLTHDTLGNHLRVAGVAAWTGTVVYPSNGVPTTFSGIVMPAVILVAIVVTAVALVARRFLAPTVAARAGAVVGCTVVVAGVAALTASQITVTQHAYGGNFAAAWQGRSFLLPNALLVGIVGAFAFGVVARVHPPVRAALRLAAAWASVIVVVTSVLALAAVMTAPVSPRGTPQGDAVGNLAQTASVVAAAAIPSAALATITVENGGQSLVERLQDGPLSVYAFNLPRGQAGVVYPRVARYAARHEHSRVPGYLGTASTTTAIVLWVALAAVWIGFLAICAVGVVRCGAPTSIDGARLGVLVAASACLLSFPLAAYGVETIRTGATSTMKFGVTPASFVGPGLVLLVAGAVAGTVVGLTRPRPRSYTPLRAGAHAPQPAPLDGPAPTPPVAAPAALATVPLPQPVDRCPSCGRPYASAARFCGGCGAPRQQGDEGAPT